MTTHGLNAFYDSVDLRQRCCDIRKVEPLARALAGRDAWVTGLRRAQGPARSALAIEERDRVHGIPKFNPLALWPDDAVWEYIQRHDVPFNPLHERGYPSIGCEPCTRAIKPGETGTRRPLVVGVRWREQGMRSARLTDDADVAAKGNCDCRACIEVVPRSH